MSHLFDSLSGSISGREERVSKDDIDLINSLTNGPPIPVTVDDVYVRKCRLTGDGINSHFGRFHNEDLEMLLEKTSGVTCLIGHRKETAGIARFFGGTIEKVLARDFQSGEMCEMSFIVPKMYWMKSHTFANDLRINIDGGVYHQASISWYFEKPVCGLCGKDIRKCDHIPGVRYDDQLCFFWYEEIGDVLEGSIVYAGGHPGTGFELNDREKTDPETQLDIFKFGKDGEISLSSIEPYLKNIEKGTVYLVGDIAESGSSSGKVEVYSELESDDNLENYLPPFVTERLEFLSKPNNGKPCVKLCNDSLLEISMFPPRKGGNSPEQGLVENQVEKESENSSNNELSSEELSNNVEKKNADLLLSTEKREASPVSFHESAHLTKVEEILGFAIDVNALNELKGGSYCSAYDTNDRDLKQSESVGLESCNDGTLNGDERPFYSLNIGEFRGLVLMQKVIYLGVPRWFVRRGRIQ